MMGVISYVRYVSRCAIAFLALIALPHGAFAADAAKGEVIAKRWCAACHLVSSDQTQANSDAPSFAAIAHKKGRDVQISRPATSRAPLLSCRSLRPSSMARICRLALNLTDEDWRVMPVAGGGFEQCYNAQAAVAAGSLLVVAVDVVQAPNDKQHRADVG
jgi:hypothetical protein